MGLKFTVIGSQQIHRTLSATTTLDVKNLTFLFPLQQREQAGKKYHTGKKSANGNLCENWILIIGLQNFCHFRQRAVKMGKKSKQVFCKLVSTVTVSSKIKEILLARTIIKELNVVNSRKIRNWTHNSYLVIAIEFPM